MEHQVLGFQTMGLALRPCYEWANTSLLLPHPPPVGSPATQLEPCGLASLGGQAETGFQTQLCYNPRNVTTFSGWPPGSTPVKREDTMTPTILACLQALISWVSHPRRATAKLPELGGRDRFRTRLSSSLLISAFLATPQIPPTEKAAARC